MRTELAYLGVSCNRTPNICDWGKNKLLCYGSCNAVVIFDPKFPGTNKNLKILTGHKKQVSAVKWVPVRYDLIETELVSVSNDCTAIVWSLQDNEYQHTVLKGHTDGVNVVECITTDIEKRSLIIVTGSIDSTVRIWKRLAYEGDIINTQTLNFDRGLCLGLSLCFLPKSKSILMACARDTSKIALYAESQLNESETEFKLVYTLKGHENWVRGLDFTIDDTGDILLASSSQDGFIRLWRISACSPPIHLSRSDAQFRTLQEIIGISLNNLKKSFPVAMKDGTKYFTINLLSVLCGHEGWVYEVRWSPKIKKDGLYEQPMVLLSASMDKTMIVWSLFRLTGMWTEVARVGEVGGNTLGFYGCKFAPDALSIISHGYLGSFHLWNYNSDLDNWEPGVTMSGHTNEVVDLAWEPNGEFLMSISLDQTTRIHGSWFPNYSDTVSWHEIARPQVHGYDMTCLAILSRYKFISGAEEKIVRAFKAPSNFVTNFRSISHIYEDIDGDNILNAGPKGASVPSLGLSNKAIFESSNTYNKEKMNETETYFHEVQLNVPPTEEDLIQNTLWPEEQKLYGHGYELFALACSNDGKFVASACKATTPQHAAIILWDAETWQQKQKLQSHTLTVTQLSFSPDGNKLLSVSRDRRWSVFERNLENNEFVLAATTDKATGIHARIIWCCAWSHDSKYFITGSREGKVIIWTKNEAKSDLDVPLRQYEAVGSPLELKGQSVTATTFALMLVNECYLVCLGLENGDIKLLKWSPSTSWVPCGQIDKSVGHHLTVKRVCFRPHKSQTGAMGDDTKIMQLASCGSDHAVKIYNIYQ